MGQSDKDKSPVLNDLVDHQDPEAVLKEVCHLWRSLYNDSYLSEISTSWRWTMQLYRGEHPQFTECTTIYHDLQHATDTALALMRMIHGANRFGIEISDAIAHTAITAALLHDAGFIKDADDIKGTGAKHTLIHVARSKEILRFYAGQEGWPNTLIDLGERMISCTDLAIEPKGVSFPETGGILTGRMLAAADLWAQMADRTYLEKLAFLYHELQEGGVDIFEDEEDILFKSPDFYQMVEHRLMTLGPVIDGFLAVHFRERWQICDNLYRISIENQRQYLLDIIQSDTGPKSHLKRDQGLPPLEELH